MMSVLAKLTYKKIWRFIPKEMGQSLGKILVNIFIILFQVQGEKIAQVKLLFLLEKNELFSEWNKNAFCSCF